VNPYNPQAQCPKCRHDDVGTRFHDGSWKGCPWGCPASASLKEHIERHCRRCHYEWAELPATDKEGGTP
jgi:hypothetical protein